MAEQGGREWSSGTFDCFSDITTCLCGLFCPMCLTCRVAERMGEPCHICVGCCLFPESIVALRVRLRTQHGIKGDVCNDFVCTMCCGACTLCQLDRELKSLGI